MSSGIEGNREVAGGPKDLARPAPSVTRLPATVLEHHKGTARVAPRVTGEPDAGTLLVGGRLGRTLPPMMPPAVDLTVRHERRT